MDIVLRRGRVVDPASGRDRVADVRVRDGVIRSIDDAGSEEPIGDADVIDVAGLIVGPGFIDLHSHVHSIPGQRLQAMDGVTTALDLEAGLMPIERAYAEAAAEGRPLNYGFSASWGMARAQVLAGIEPDADFGTALRMVNDADWQRSSSARELDEWLGLLAGELAGGALGIGVLLGYAPRSDPAEFLRVAALAAEAGVPTYTHVRELVESDPSTPVDGSFEIARAAAETGAAMHHCHVNATSRRHVDRVLSTLDAGHRDGSRITLETYPYGSGSTAIGAAFLAPERLALWGLDESDIVVLATRERVADAGRLAQLRADDPGAACIVDFLDERDPADSALLFRALAYPDAIVASDAMPLVSSLGALDPYAWPVPPGVRTHPRTAGTFAKTLRLMVIESGTWSWVEAFRRCSLLPAELLGGVAPAARAKGRLEVGADADLVVIDPERVTDNATPFDPIRPSSGIRHSLVAGTFVVRHGELQRGAFPGRPLRGESGVTA